MPRRQLVRFSDWQNQQIQVEFVKAGHMAPRIHVQRQLAERIGVSVQKLRDHFKYLRRREPGHSRYNGDDPFIHHPLSASAPSHSTAQPVPATSAPPDAIALPALATITSPAELPPALPSTMEVPDALPADPWQGLDQQHPEPLPDSIPLLVGMTNGQEWGWNWQALLAIPHD